jgi:hypothetical protein
MGRCPRSGQQLVDIGAVAGLAGDAAGRGVGLGEQSPLLEGSHGRTHRGGAGPQAKAAHQGFAAHGFGGVDVMLHRCLQNLLLAGGKALQGWAVLQPANCVGA